jgi:hypothetical protein
MSTSRRRGGMIYGVALASALVMACTGPTPQPISSTTPAPAALAAPNNNPAFVQVYVNNVENLEKVDDGCPGDWQDLVHYLSLQELRPDIFLVQQISNQGQLDLYTARLSSEFGEAYAGVIAEASPARMNSPCGSQKAHQTNAVIYRTGRFTLISDPDASTKRWQSQAHDGTSCVNNDQARTKNVKAMLHDDIADQDITVASIHWPTAAMDGPPCAESNAREAIAELLEDGYGGSLLIFGGDGNVTDTDASGDFRPWYAGLNGDLGGTHGYRDASYAGCADSGEPINECLAENWTIGGNRRIDYVFARRGDGTMPQMTYSHTVTFNEGDAADLEVTGTDRRDRSYSDHRAIRVRVHY